MDNLPNMDPLSQYDYSYPNYSQLPNTEYNYNVKTEPYHIPVANNLQIPQQQYNNIGPYPAPNLTYQNNEKSVLPQEKPATENHAMEFNIPIDNQNQENKEEEIDTKENIVLLPQHRKRKPKNKGRTSSYWNKKIEDKNFPFYGCTICNINYKTLQELDEHVTIHKGRITSYDIRVRNQQKRKERLKEMRRLKKLGKLISKKKGKVKIEEIKKKEIEIEIKPEEGYIGTEKASDFANPTTDNQDQSANDKTNDNGDSKNEDVKDDKSNVKEPEDPRLLKLFKCFACQKQFSLSYYLRLHVRSHTDEKPYTCAQCGQSFITASKLNRHNKRIHLAIRFQCRICYRFFSRFDALTKHFDKKHADDKIEGEPYDYNAILPYLKELEEQLKEQSELKDQKPKAEDVWGDGSTQNNNLNNFEHTDKIEIEVEKVEKEELKEEMGPNHEHVIFGDNPHIIVGENPIFVKEKAEPVEEIVVEAFKEEMLEEHLDGTLDEHADDHLGDDARNDFRDDRLSLVSETDQPYTKKHDYEEEVEQEMIEEHLDDSLEETNDNHKPRHRIFIIDDDSNEHQIIYVDDNSRGDSHSDEDYFPSNTWAAPPKPEPSSPPNNKEKTKKKKRRPSDFPMKCEECEKTINSSSYYKIHMRTHTGERPYKCYICSKGFITSGKMSRHVLTHQEYWEKEDENGEKKIKTEEMDEVKQENEEEDGIKKTRKRKCKNSAKAGVKGKPIKIKRQDGEPRFKKYRRRPHACVFCNKRFLHLETLQVHKKSHEGQELILKCSFCLEVMPDEETLKGHEATHGGPRPYICTVCNRTYTKKETMVYHRKTHEENKKTEFICDICSKSFNAQCKLQRHIVSHKVEKFVLRYECPVCAHMFHTKYHIQMHLTTHQKEGLILEENRSEILAMVQQNARKIPQKAAEGANIANIDLIPPDERSRVCNICGQVFQHFYYLEEHIKSHASTIAIEDEIKEEEKKHICPVCNKGFKLHYYLKLHSFTHTKEKPFICQQCGKGFITKGKLKRHLETHTGLKKYQCHICYKFFTRPSYLRIHVRTIHGTQDYNFTLDKQYVALGQDNLGSV